MWNINFYLTYTLIFLRFFLGGALEFMVYLIHKTHQNKHPTKNEYGTVSLRLVIQTVINLSIFKGLPIIHTATLIIQAI